MLHSETLSAQLPALDCINREQKSCLIFKKKKKNKKLPGCDGVFSSPSPDRVKVVREGGKEGNAESKWKPQGIQAQKEERKGLSRRVVQ